MVAGCSKSIDCGSLTPRLRRRSSLRSVCWLWSLELALYSVSWDKTIEGISCPNGLPLHHQQGSAGSLEWAGLGGILVCEMVQSTVIKTFILRLWDLVLLSSQVSQNRITRVTVAIYCLIVSSVTLQTLPTLCSRKREAEWGSAFPPDVDWFTTIEIFTLSLPLHWIGLNSVQICLMFNKCLDF